MIPADGRADRGVGTARALAAGDGASSMQPPQNYQSLKPRVLLLHPAFKIPQGHVLFMEDSVKRQFLSQIKRVV